MLIDPIRNKYLTILTNTTIALLFSITAIVVSIIIIITKKKFYSSIEKNDDCFIEIAESNILT